MYVFGIIFMVYRLSSMFIVETASLMLDHIGTHKEYAWPILYNGCLLTIAAIGLAVVRYTISPCLLFKIQYFLFQRPRCKSSSRLLYALVALIRVAMRLRGLS